MQIIKVSDIDYRDQFGAKMSAKKRERLILSNEYKCVYAFELARSLITKEKLNKRKALNMNELKPNYISKFWFYL